MVLAVKRLVSGSRASSGLTSVQNVVKQINELWLLNGKSRFPSESDPESTSLDVQRRYAHAIMAMSIAMRGHQHFSVRATIQSC